MISNTIQVLHNIPESQEKRNKSLEKLLLSMPRSRASAFDLVASLWFKYKKVYIKQETLAIRIDNRCRATANRALRDLADSGLIIKVYRGVKQTCLYMLPDFITKDMCKKLCKYLKSFRYFNVKFLCSRTIATLSPEIVTQVNSSLNFIYLQPRSPRSIVGKNGAKNINISERKEYDVKKDESIVMTPAIHDAAIELSLTLHGKIKLRAFEDDSIRYALMRLDKARGINNRFEFVCSTALAHAQEHRTGPNWKRYYSLRESYQIDANDKNFTEEEVVPKKQYSHKGKKSEAPRFKSSEEKSIGEKSNARQRQFEEDDARRQKLRDAQLLSRPLKPYPVPVLFRSIIEPRFDPDGEVLRSSVRGTPTRRLSNFEPIEIYEEEADTSTTDYESSITNTNELFSTDY